MWRRVRPTVFLMRPRPNDLPLLPGAATASEVMRLLERGYTVQKFFPAEVNGGVPALKAIGAPIPQVRFCPTGGITLANAPNYLALANVLCVGGSWVAPQAMVSSGDWAGITRLATEAAASSASGTVAQGSRRFRVARAGRGR